MKPIVWTDEELDQAINGGFTVTRMGQEVGYKLTKQEKQAFDLGKEQGFILRSNRSNLRNAFSQWCEIHAQPYIYMEKHAKYVRVCMDLIFCDDAKGYQEDKLFEDKLLTVISAIGIENADYAAGGTYNYISRVLPEHAEYVARSFLAIYWQHKGLTATAPALPDVAKDSKLFAQMLESKERRYAFCSKGRQWLNWRWKVFCDAYQWPCIKLKEDRKGRAKLEIEVPSSMVLPPDIKQALEHIEHVFFSDTHINIFRSIPTIEAIRLAENFVKMFDSAGYFPPIDESWHE